MNSLVVGVGAFVILLAILVAIRSRTGNRFEVKNSDIVLALVPIGLWLLLTGKIKEFSVGDFKIVAAIEAASRATVEKKVTELPVEAIRTEMKGRGILRAWGASPSRNRISLHALNFDTFEARACAGWCPFGVQLRRKLRVIRKSGSTHPRRLRSRIPTVPRTDLMTEWWRVELNCNEPAGSTEAGSWSRAAP